MKLLLIRIMMFFSRVYSNLMYQYCKLTGNISDVEDFDILLAEVENFNPEEFQDYIRENFTYQADGWVDYSKHYLQFMYDEKGDCDDFAHLCAKLLERMGFDNVHLITVMADSNFGHAICVAEKNGKVYGFGNWRLIHFPSNDLREMGNHTLTIWKGWRPDIGQLSFVLKFDSEWNYIDSIFE